MDLLTLILQAAFYLLFVVALVGFVRRPGPLTLDILLLFGSLAGLFAVGLLALVLPAAEQVAGLIAFALLLAQPALALRLIRHVSRLPRWIGAAMAAGYLVIFAALLAFGSDQPIGLGLAGAYFVVGDGLAAIVLVRAARRRRGIVAWRMLLAAGAMALIAAVIVVAFVGGEAGSVLAPAFGVLVALAFLPAFAPPRWLRQLGQQAVAYRFLRDLSAIEPGAGEHRLWQQLADAAMSLTGALRAAVHLAGPGSDQPVAVAGAADGAGDRLTCVAFGTETQQGELYLRTRGEGLFEDDDLELIRVLGMQTAGAVEREAVLAERTAIGQRLAATNVELARASAAKSDFLAAMSHELRTPLNAIIGFSELLLTPPSPLTEEAIREYAGHINGAGQHLLALINDILDLSRIEAGRLELRHETTNVARLLSETLGTVRPLAEVKGLSLEAELPEELLADVDAARVRQVAYNLLSNAIKFTPADGRVTVALASEDHAFTMRVTDTGPGIAEEDQERIFAAFEQLTPGSGEGTGLGLALTRRLVEAHGGHISVASAPGDGTRFEVRLPLRRPTMRPVTPVAADDGDGPLVLIIEDDAAAAELLRLQLTQAGYRAAVAGDGESGLEAARDLRPAAILLDILLPGLDGWEVLRRLRADGATGRIPVMVITVVDNAALGLALGAVDYFVKPVSRETLLGALARFTLTTKVRERTVSILVIDDDPAARRLYRETLKPEGFTVLEAANGEAGLERAGAADAIVLDILLPDIDGFEVAARLRSNPDTSGIPILVVTGQELSDADKARLHEHALAVLAKGDEAMTGLRAWLGQVEMRSVA